MTVVYITGLSGAGKSYTLDRLNQLGYEIVDTDYGYIKNIGNGVENETVLDEEKLVRLLNKNGQSHLFIAGIYSNQSQIYKYIDHVVLLAVEYNEMVKRINDRSTNDYGKALKEKEKIIYSFNHVLPLLKKSSDTIIDTTDMDIDEVCKKLVNLLE